MSFWVWLVSLSVTASSFAQVVAGVSVSFFLRVSHVPFHGQAVFSLSAPLLKDTLSRCCEYSYCKHGVQRPLSPRFQFFGSVPGRRVVGSHGDSICRCLRSPHTLVLTVPHSGSAISHPHQWLRMRFQFLHSRTCCKPRFTLSLSALIYQMGWWGPSHRPVGGPVKNGVSVSGFALLMGTMVGSGLLETRRNAGWTLSFFFSLKIYYF